MTATEHLRQLLDERGVEWSTNETLTDCWTRWGAGKFRCTATEINGTFAFTVGNSTPEQAVAATLGGEDTYTREEAESAFVRGFSLGSLPVGSDPQWDENRQTVDEHMAELGWVRISDAGDNPADANGHDSGHVRNSSATLGRGTCRDVTSEERTQAFTCSECGCWVAYDEYWETGIYVEGEGQAVHIHPRYCPNCGREVVEPTINDIDEVVE